jgi:hypothetical protein
MESRVPADKALGEAVFRDAARFGGKAAPSTPRRGLRHVLLPYPARRLSIVKKHAKEES